MSGQTYAVSAPIVINVTSTIQGPMGIDLGGATIVSQITNGAPVIQINAGPGVDLRYLTLSNFTIQGNGREGAGIKVVADGNDRWIYNFTVDNVTVRGVGGYGLDVQGSVFEGLISNSSMIGNRLGGAYFGHSAGGGQVSALRWFGGKIEDNGGTGIFLGNGARDLSIDGITVANNNGDGISAEWGITSVTDSQFRDNRGDGIWFQNFGYFNSNTFTTSGVQATGMSAWVTGNAVVSNSRSVYTGSGSDLTVLANLQGTGSAYIVGDTGKIITGPALGVAGLGGGNLSQVTVSSQGASVPALASVVSATAATASTGSDAFEQALSDALGGGTVGSLSGKSFTVTTPIVIYLNASSQGPIGIDLGGAKIVSQVMGGRAVIEIVAGPGVNVSNLTLSNFSVVGNGSEGDGIRIVAAGADRSINLLVSNVNVEHVGGTGLEILGNVSGTVFDSWMHGNAKGGAVFANSGGGTADSLRWVGGGFRKNGVAGLILENGASDMTVQGAYFVENEGAGVYATSGITRIEQSGFENNARAGAWVGGSSTFLGDTFSTHGDQIVGIAGSINGGKVTLLGTGNEYYGGGWDPTALINLQGSGTLSVAGVGKVIAGPGISVTGGSAVPSGSFSPAPTPVDTIAPTIASIAASGASLTNGSGTVGDGATVNFTVAMSEAVTVTGTPTLSLSSGGKATYAGGSGGSSLAFTHMVASGQSASDLSVTSFNLEGGRVADAAGNAANLGGAVNYNPAGILKVDTGSTTTPTSPSPVTTPKLVKAVNVGGGQATAASGVVFEADSGPTTGGSASQVFSTTAGIAGTTDDVLYQNERYTPGGSYTYEIAVANGTYQVDLLFAEIYSGIFGSGQRVFDMSLEGQALSALQNIDIYSKVGLNAAFTISQSVTVNDGSLSIQVGPGNSSPGNFENAKLNAFAVYSTSGQLPTVSIAAADASRNEGNSGGTPFTFNVTRGGSTAAASTVAFAVAGTGTNPATAADFTGGAFPTGTVSFAVGETTKIITVNVAGDNTVEPNKNFAVTLANATAGTAIGTATASGTILNDDSASTPAGLGFTSIASANGQVTLKGTSGAADRISIYDGMTWMGHATAGDDGTWSFNAKAASGTTHTYGVNATSPVGKTSTTAARARLGSTAADTLTGGSGNDVIAGGPGNDVLTGGAGADIFAFTAAPISGNLDRITDFASGTDKLAFARSTFVALSVGELSPAAFVQAAAAMTSEQRVIFNAASGIVSYDADGSGSGAAVAVAQLATDQVLKAQDIKVY
ncbi:malectin domain-containing carbohydrate-binding protein [Reyranella soli]|nr:malectin domain-containing carbohydrate-binding protein [Reyranella soli]